MHAHGTIELMRYTRQCIGSNVCVHRTTQYELKVELHAINGMTDIRIIGGSEIFDANSRPTLIFSM